MEPRPGLRQSRWRMRSASSGSPPPRPRRRCLTSPPSSSMRSPRAPASIPRRLPGGGGVGILGRAAALALRRIDSALHRPCRRRPRRHGASCSSPGNRIPRIAARSARCWSTRPCAGAASASGSFEPPRRRHSLMAARCSCSTPAAGSAGDRLYRPCGWIPLGTVPGFCPGHARRARGRDLLLQASRRRAGALVRPACARPTCPRSSQSTTMPFLASTAVWNWHPRRPRQSRGVARGTPGPGLSRSRRREGRGALGYASFGDWRPFDGYRHTVEHSVYAAQDARGRGLGKALASTRCAEAQRAGQACHARRHRGDERGFARRSTAASASSRRRACPRSAASSSAGSTSSSCRRRFDRRKSLAQGGQHLGLEATHQIGRRRSRRRRHLAR